MYTQNDLASEAWLATLLEAPISGSADFYRRWLSAAADLQRLWEEIRQDVDFQKQHKTLSSSRGPDFDQAASLMIEDLGNDPCMMIFINQIDGWYFSVMSKLGFFEKCEEHYRLSIPSSLTRDAIRNAILSLELTDDRPLSMNPECSVQPLSIEKIEELQDRLGLWCSDRS